MKKKTLRRIATIATAAALGVGACIVFAGCTSNYPEITITYTFNDNDYKVSYSLSRVDAPNTVKHFIELADMGYYDGLCIHDFDDEYMYSGGYRLVNDELEAIDYFTTVRNLEQETNKTITQTVWNRNDETPLYTVYGEFRNNGNAPANSAEYRHSLGALVMYYSDKGNFNEKVKTVRNDGGKDNNGDPYDLKAYPYNCATSLFYTYLGSSNSTRDSNYCVFGMVKDKDELQALLDAVKSYQESQQPEDESEDYSFTEEKSVDNVNEFEQFEDLRYGDISATYQTPVEKPIIISSVKVTKY